MGKCHIAEIDISVDISTIILRNRQRKFLGFFCNFLLMYSKTSFEWFSIVSNTFDVKRQCLPNEVANMKSINVK